MKIKTFGHFVNEGFRSVVRNKMMSTASVISVTAALFILGVFMILVVNVNTMANSVTSKIQIEGYVNGDISISEQHTITNTLEGIKGVKSVEFISKEKALDKFKGWLGDNKSLANGLDSQNPLPASFIIKVNNPSDVDYVAAQMKEMNIFSKINDGKSIVDKLIKITGFIKIASIVLMLILGAVAILIISNTIKLTVYARKKEIGIMKYIGATDWFIRWPFIIEGVTLGLIGAIFSILLIWISYSYVSKLVYKVIMTAMVTPGELISQIGLPFCLVGVLIGGIGSMLSIRKFLVK